MSNNLPTVEVTAIDPNKGFSNEEKEYIRRPYIQDKDKAREEVLQSRLNNKTKNNYFNPIKGAKDRFISSFENNTNPLIGLNKTVGKSLTGAQAATTLPYILTRGLSTIPKLKDSLAPLRQFFSKNYNAGITYGNLSDIGQIIENPLDLSNYVEIATGKMTGRAANTGLGVGGKKWLGTATIDGVANINGFKNGGKINYLKKYGTI